MKLKSLNKLGFMLMSLGIIVLIALTLRAITPATQSLPLRDVSPLKAAIPALDSPRDRVMAAWDQAREAGAYDFSADILQKTIPLPSPTNVGRTSKTERLHLEGHTNLPGRTMQLTLWTEGGNILDAHRGLEVKVEDERVLARQGSGDWQEINNFTGLFAPDGDFMAFLSAAKEIASHGSETRAGVPFSRYTFQVDGPGYAAYLRNQLEREMAAKGELPPGISLDLPRQYVDMTGTGELWLSQDGLPLRQLIHLSFPPSADQDHRLEAEIRVDFANFGQAGKTTATRDVNPTADSQQPTADSRQPMLLLIIALLLYTMLRFIRRHSRNLYMGATSVVIVSMLLSPLMQNHHVSAFYARQRAELEAQEGLQQESNMMQTLSTLYETRPGPRPAAAVSASSRRAGSASSRRAGSLALIRADDGSDADSDGMTDIGEAFLGSNPFGPDRSEQPAIIQAAAVDADGDLLPDANDPCPADPDCDDDGLTDYEETLLGTDLFSPDTDGDLISDTLEVEGFFANGQTWYSDPLEVDSNRDGLGDAQEWRFSDANWDTDGDGAPDLHDRDNDGDGVPDNLDLSPFANFPQIFSRDDPFELLVENLASRPAYIEFQLRPTNPDHLWYTYNVLDWPRYDISGQMQDEDGWTFHDYCVHNSLLQGQNLNAQCPLTPDDNGDLKLIPSLEIEFDFDSIPPTSSFFRELDAYSISRRYASDFQKATYIVPLQLVTDNQGGEQVAFYGKFFFRQSGSWGAAHKIRFAWIVQALVDNACVQQDSSGNCVLKQDNVLQPIHAYYDDWQLTGFNIQENHGTDVAQIFEDPAVDPDLQRDDALLGLANGLDQSLLAGRPNPNFPDQRNPRVLSLKIKFDHLASALQGPFRWNLPDILRVEKGTFPEGRYSHLDEAMTHLITTDTVKILDDHFTPAWTAANPITPTILVAYEEHFRAVNLDDEGGPDDPGRNTLSWNGPQLTVNMNGDGGNQVTTLASLKWTPYVYDGQAWQAAPIEDYWNELDRRYQAEFDAQNPDPEVAAGKLLITQLYYLVLFSGVQSVVQRGNSVLAQNGPKTDFEIADQAGFVLGQSLQLPNEIWKALGGIKRFQVGSAANFLTSKGRSDLSAALRTSRLKTAIGVSVVAIILISLSVLGRVFAEELGLSEQASLGFKISAAVVLGLLVLSLQIIKPIITTTRLISAAGSSVLNAGDAIESRRILRSVSKGAKVLAVVGFIIDLGINWGLFFAQWLAGDIEPGTIAFNHAIAVAVGATVLALLVLALAFIPIVGPIIIAILILADIILSFFDTSLAELIAGDIHGGGPLVETRARDDISNESHRPPKALVILENFGIQLVGGGSASLVDGERAQFVADITTNAYHPIPNSATAWDHTNEVWNNDTLKRSAFRYELSEGRQIRLPSLNERASDWRDIREWARVRFQPYDTTASLKSGRLSDAATSRPITLAQGINRRMGDLHFKMAYRIAAYECWGFIGYDCGVSPDNDIQTFAGSLVEPLNLILDIFPNTLDGFYALDWAGDLYDFAPHADFDGDGLMTQDDPFFGSDPDDTLWDSDGDGLSDRFELELSSLGVAFSPLLSDTDNDGLSDADELRLGDGFVVSERYRLGSNPAAADTDGDGLTDLAEVTGWQFVYAPGKVTWVTSDPAKRDSDGDGLSDKIERDLHASDPTRFPFHPRVPNEAAFIGLDYQFDAGTFYQGKPFIGSQTAAYTTTLVNQLTPVYALSGALSLSLPPALQLTGGATTNPFYLAGGETQANSFGLAAAAGAASGPVALTNQIFFQLDERGLAGWRWGLLQPNINSAAGGDYPWFSAVAPATGWSAPLLLASIEGAKVTSGTLFDTARVRVYGLNNGALGPPLTVDDDLHPDKWVDAPDIACNSAGRCLVVWSEPAAGSIQNLYGAIIDNALTVSVPRFAIAGSGAAQQEPAVASNGADFVVAWTEAGQIQSRRVTAAGVQGVIRLLSSGDSQHPDLIWAGGQYLAVWQQLIPGSGEDVLARLLDIDGAPGAQPFAVGDTVDQDDEHPQAAFDTNTGKTLVVYRVSGNRIDARTVDPASASVGPPFTIGARGSDAQLFEPRLAYDAANQGWLAAWLSQNNLGLDTMRYQALAPDISPRANARSFTFANSAPVHPAGIGLVCDGNCAFTGSTPPWQDAADSRSIFINQATLDSVAPPATGLQAINEEVAIVIDNDRPASQVDNLLNGQYFVPGSDRVIQGRATDATSAVQSVELSQDGVNWEAATGHETWQYVWTIPAAEGGHTLHIRATDVSGNVEEPPTTYNYIVDGSPPTITSNLAPNSILRASRNSDGQFVIPLSGTGADPSLPGGLNGSGVANIAIDISPNSSGRRFISSPGSNWSAEYPLPRAGDDGARLSDPTGHYTITLTAGDFAWGNQGGSGNATTLQIPIQLDNQAPFSALTTDLSQTQVITEPLRLTGLITETGSVIAGVAAMEVAYFPADIGLSPGLWQASYFNNSGWQQPPAAADMVSDIDFDWGSDAPTPELGPDNFSVNWQRETMFRISGTYHFSASHDADAEVTLLVDNFKILDSATGTLSNTVHIDAGTQPVYVSYREGSGEARVAVRIELMDPDWQTISIDQAGAGVVNSSWSYTIPTGLEGFYRLGIRGVDQLGNRDEQSFNWEVWRGHIDTAAPRVSLALYYTGFGSTEQTHYIVSVEDFNLAETSLSLPCGPETFNRLYYPTGWWRDWFQDEARLFEITASCSLPGFRSEPPPVSACDRQGHCTSLNEEAPLPPNFRSVYWSEQAGGASRIQQISLQNIGAGAQTLVANTGLTHTIGLAVDADNGFIYWTDETAGTINRANLADGAGSATLVSGLGQPTGLALDPAANQMYWAEFSGGEFNSGRIAKANLDGGNEITVTTRFNNPTSIALDSDAGKIYWMEQDLLLSRSDLDGSNMEGEIIAHEVFCLPSEPADVALDLINNNVYWLDMACTPDPGNNFFDEGIYRAAIPPDSTTAGSEYLVFTDQSHRRSGLAVDVGGRKVYWTNGDKLLRANLDGSSIETVVSGLTEPAGIALNFNYAPETPAVTIPVYQNQAADIILPVIDYENDPLSFSDIVSPVHGALIGVPPNLTYTPGPNFIGHDSLTYTASDNHGGSNTGMVRFSVIRPAEPDSIITMPGQGAVLTNTAPISVAGSASAVDYLKSLTVTVDNAVVYTRSFAPATVTDTTWTTTWDPAGFGEGAHTLVSVVSDQNNTLQTDIHPISVWLDLGLPAIAITPTLLTGSHKLPQPGMVALRGVVSDTAAVASVQIRVNGGAWEPATVAGSTWTYAWPVEGSLDGQAYTVSGLVSDVAGQTDQITETVTVDVVPPSPVTVTLAYTNSGGVRVPVSPGQTIVDSPITLSIDWTASSDGAGLAGYLAGWTLSDTPDPAFLTQYGTTARHHAQVPGEAQILYAHLMVQDVNGNTTRQTLGPIYVDAPTTPDLIDDFAYRGWMSGGGSQIGKDREISRTTTLPPQALYVSWNADNLRLTWSGANWDGDGDLFIYLDTGPGGAGAAYNPYADALPAVGLGITANYLLWVEDGDTATLLNWNGATWVVDTVLTPANFQLDMAIRPAHTDLLIPFSWLGINNPAAAALNLVAFASEEDSLDLWATMPSHNPLNSLRVTSPIIEPQTVNLTRSYAWPSLGPNQTPNAGQFADTDLLVTISSAPAGISVGYLADDLLDLLPPGGRLDADLNGVLDIGLPFSQDVQPLAVGQPVTYTVHYENRGSQTAGGATVLATALGPLSFDSGSSKLISLPDIGPAISGTVTFTATVTNPGASVELNAQVADAFHGPFEWWWLQHDVDIAPPTGLTILPSFTYVRSLTNTTLGLVQDPSGVPAITLEITTLPDNGVNFVTCLDDSPRDGLWACNWSLGPITSISQVALRAKATDGAGNITPAWSDPITLTVDTTPPTVTLAAALESLFANGFIAAGPVTLNGTVADDRQATGVELCDQGTNCVQVGVTPGNTASGVWIHPFAPVAEGDGITQVLVLYGLDAAGNRSAPLTRAYRIDTIPPVITVTTALSQVTLPGSSAVMAGTVAGSEFVAEPPTPTPTAIPEPASLPRPTVTPENPAFSLRDNAIYLPVILGGGLRRAQPSGQRVEVIETVEPVRRAHVEPVVTTGPEVAAPEAPIMVQKLAAIPILSGAYSDSGGFSQLYGQVQGPDGSITWSVAERDATTWRFWLPPVETPGQYKITLEAWDMAGNSRSYGPFSLTVTVNGGGGNSFDLYLPIVMK